jgi:hypothetical protein
MKKLLVVLIVVLVVVAGVIVVGNLLEEKKPKPGTVLDEALAAGRTPESLAGADEDYYHDMDYGATHDPEALRAALDPYVPGITAEDAVEAVARGRNNWVVWSGGNDRFWDDISLRSFGALDFVKTISNHPSLGYSRDNRWQYLGLVNEPCFTKASGPRQDRFGLWLDERVEGPDCPPDPFENEDKYPGVMTGARGKNVPVGSYYGYATGVMGLRLFPNPAFDEKAEAEWDAERYYSDPDYYNQKRLIKPYRVGMACGFCHVGPNPSNPPTDPENPNFANLNSNPGAQYYWTDRVFFWNPEKADENFVYQVFHTYRPGALDTSLVSSDMINNPRTMNAVYSVGPRLAQTLRWGKETLAGGGLDNKQFNEFLPAGSPLARYYVAPDTVFTPRVLKDGSDSVGALGALNRVFINIGMFSEEWLLHFIPLIGGPDVTPIEIAVAEKNSSYWKANELQTPDTALFFLATAKPDKLAAAPDGAAYLTAEQAELHRGKVVFAERCARCHSSKLPEKAYTDFFPGNGCVGPNYLECWNDYWRWTKGEEFKSAARDIVLAPDFLEENFLSTELRVPVTLLETNACSPLATNALAGNIWDNFSSQSYKSLPAVGKVLVHRPYSGEPYEYDMPGGGRGYTRPASLISLWSTAPYLLNNSVGGFQWTGSVQDRMQAFEDGITQMLWPEKRAGARSYATRSGKEHPGVIDVTTERSYLKVSAGFLPDFLVPLTGLFDRLIPNVFGGGGVMLGPIPQGTPVNLLANIDLEDKGEVLRLLLKIKRDLKKLPRDATDDQAREVFRDLVAPLLAVSKCPDFVVNRGHYFGTDYLPESESEPGLSDEDKRALIAFLETF